jgi:hypothetical protein
MSVVKTEQRRYLYDYIQKGLYDSNPVRKTGVTGDILNYVDKGDSPKGWQQLIRAGLGATSTLVGLRTTLEQNSFRSIVTGKGSWKGYTALTSGKMPLSVTPWGANVSASTLEAAARSSAANRLHGQIQNARTKFQGATFLAEVVDVIRMFRNPVEALFGSTMYFAKEVRKLCRGWGAEKHSTTSKKLASLWLAYSYGIKPLAADITSFAIATDQLSNHLGSRTSVPISGAAEEASLLEENYYAFPGTTYARQLVHTRNVCSVRYHGKYWCSADFGPFASMGFDLPALAVATWEAIPFSFLVDYFVNVNEVLRANTQANADIAWLEYGRKIDRTVQGFGARINPILPDTRDHFDVECSGGEYKATKSTVFRTQTGLPSVGLRLTLPTASQGLNIAALTAVIAQSKPR